MSEELAYWLKKANFWMVKFGIESASDRVLRGIKKKMSKEKTIHACELAADAGIKVYGFFMLYQVWEENGELQYETPEEVQCKYRLREAALEARASCTTQAGRPPFLSREPSCTTSRAGMAWWTRTFILPRNGASSTISLRSARKPSIATLLQAGDCRR